MKLLETLRQKFIYTSDRHMEISYFNMPIWDSPSFRRNTGVMVVALVLGIVVAVSFWKSLRETVLACLMGSLVMVVGTWLRTIADHRRMARVLAEAPADEISKETLKMAAGGVNFTSYMAYAGILMMIMALFLTLAHCGRV
jgi:hypothetical protein